MAQNEDVFEPRNGWEVYSNRLDAVEDFAKRYIAFLSECKTERETIAWVANALRKAGYSEQFCSERKLFSVCRGKSLFAARKGRRPLSEGFHLIGAHADSPRLDFKQRPLIEQAAVGQAKTHYYGGIRKYQWLARPLALHGVVVRQDGSIVTITLGETPGEPVFTIADLLPHLAHKEASKPLSEAFEAEKLNVVLGHRPAELKDEEKRENAVKLKMLQLLREKYDISEEDLMSSEIQAVPAGPASPVGLDGSLVGGYGQDDRICVFTSVQALLESEEPEYTSIVMLWDKEEIGSEGSTGAQSRFLENCLKDLRDAWEPGASFRSFVSKSKALSADVHGALDPDWQELHEKQNSALIGYGPCFCKFTGSRGKYGANDAHPEYIGWLRGILNGKGIPWQMAELGKVDIGGGGTVALYLAAYNMDVIDCGPALLGMHSPFELSSKVDIFAAKELYAAFFSGC